MANVLGLDLGEKRVGVALGEETTHIASPHTVLNYRGRGQLVADLKEIVEDYQISKVIVGFPKTLSGEVGIAAQNIEKQVALLSEAIPLKWILWDERLSTREVERLLLDADLSREKRKQVRDSLAAQRILQNYFDFKRLNPGS